MARASEGTQGAGDMRIASVSDEAGSSNPESSAALGQRVDASIWQQHAWAWHSTWWGGGLGQIR